MQEINTEDKVEYHMLHIWTRDDYGETKPTLTLVETSKDKLYAKFERYFRANKEMEDYLSDEEFEEYAKDILEVIRAGEYNSAYVTDYSVDKNDY